jgi:hypothetical protein
MEGASFLFLDHPSIRNQDFEISWWLLTLAQSQPLGYVSILVPAAGGFDSSAFWATQRNATDFTDPNCVCSRWAIPHAHGRHSLGR